MKFEFRFFRVISVEVGFLRGNWIAMENFQYAGYNVLFDLEDETGTNISNIKYILRYFVRIDIKI